MLLILDVLVGNLVVVEFQKLFEHQYSILVLLLHHEQHPFKKDSPLLDDALVDLEA